MKKRVLFICVHNSARSQMAEAWLNRLCGNEFEAESAGLTPGNLNPLVVKAMQEVGIDISGKRTRGIEEPLRSGTLFAYVITVCDEASAERCPIFPGVTTRLNWNFPDPSKLKGSGEEKLQEVRQIRDDIRSAVERWCATVCEKESP